MNKHIPAPWQSRGIDILAIDSEGDFVAVGQCNGVASFASTPYIQPKSGQSLLNAAHIVHCVNSHDELTTALASERMHKGALISRIAELEKALEYYAVTPSSYGHVARAALKVKP